MLNPKRPSKWKKTLVASTVIATLALSACGSSDEEDTAAAGSSATPTSSAVVTSAAESSALQSSAADATDVSSDAAAPEAEAEAEAAAVDPAVDPAAALEQAQIAVTELQPVQGQPASDADAAAITSLVTNINNETTLRGYIAYVPNRTCSRVIEANGGQAALDFSVIPDAPLSTIPEAADSHVDGVSDIVINGNTASATVTATSNGQTTTGTQRFLNEGGNWLFCDDQG
ncbi:hypothetical protein PAB09_08680 [Corynebacterium sp. SCR221107]|uniref:hypothetical protein n=1 Tax=Corynebacterium sp. SCR221107 TaxID=3017361 RepID=UPI0022EC25BF|nr:hypothetical protein [Corynebacterium sp. SCR221107]WBT07979.1 hypothetical protein PAB09_08680 [Corynebacterium sp. SCR221107]